MTYTEKLNKAVSKADSTLCVGLDPNLNLLPKVIKETNQSATHKVAHFLKKVIDITSAYCAAYKPNIGFFEALGPDGIDLFQEIITYIPNDKVVLADVKRGDISSTAEHYAQAFFEEFKVDAVTLNPLMGFETLNPFLGDSSKGIYVLTLTSNPGAKDLLLQRIEGGQTISEYIAQQLDIKQQTADTYIGMVVGATKAPDLEPIITLFEESPLLIPGIGKQGGSVDELSAALENHKGTPLINSSRSIIYAGSDTDHWEESIGNSAKNLKKRLTPITKNYV